MANDLSSVDRLNAVYDLYTKRGNNRLDEGEVDALAGFYCGLKPSDKAQIIDRMVEIYQISSYASDQRNLFRELLKGCGIPVQKLEGTGETVDSFLKMPKDAQFARLLELERAHQTHVIEEKDIAPDARAKISKSMNEICADLANKWKKKKDSDFSLGERKVYAISMKEPGKKDTLIGYSIALEIYAEEHGLDEAYFFNLRGDYVGSDYRGE